MNRVAVALVACALGCKVSASSSTGTANPDGPGKPAATADGGGQGGTTPEAGPAGQPGDAPAPAACVPALNDWATSLFSGRVVIRLPKGVELVEQNPFFAQAAAPNQQTSCGQQVRYAAVGYFEYPANATATQLRDELLALRGIPAETLTWSEEGARGRTYTAAYAAAVDPKTQAPETRGWLVLRDAPNDKFVYFAIFEAEPAVFDAVKPLFQEAGRKLLVKPRAAQGPEAVEAAPAAGSSGSVKVAK